MRMSMERIAVIQRKQSFTDMCAEIAKYEPKNCLDASGEYIRVQYNICVCFRGKLAGDEASA